MKTHSNYRALCPIVFVVDFLPAIGEQPVLGGRRLENPESGYVDGAELGYLVVEVVVHHQTSQQEVEIPFSHIYISDVIYDNCFGRQCIAFKDNVFPIVC